MDWLLLLLGLKEPETRLTAPGGVYLFKEFCLETAVPTGSREGPSAGAEVRA